MSEKQIKEYYERIEKLLNGANKETYGFAPQEIKNILRSYDELQNQNQELKKQLEEYENELEKADSITQSCIFNGKKESEISYRKCLNMLEKHKNQQKEFINYLEDLIKFYKNRDSYMVVDIHGSYDLNNIELELLEEILQKYKETIGVSDDETN